MKLRIFIVFILTMLWVPTGCDKKKGTSTGNPLTGNVSIAMTGSAQPATVAKNFFHRIMESIIGSGALALPPPAMVDANGTSVSLSTAWVALEALELEANETPQGGETSGVDVDFPGPYFIDLLTSTPTPMDTQPVQLVQYRRIKMKLHKQSPLPAGPPAGLDNNSIYFEGAVGGVSFSYSASDSSEISIGGANPIVPDSNLNLLVVIRFSRLISRIDLGAIMVPTAINEGNPVPAGNPCPLIDASAADLFTCFRTGFESETNFGKDDGDNDLTSSDDTVR